MKLTFFANACCILEQDGFRLLTDPWLVDGVFEGSWCHFPPLKTKPQDVADVDAVYVSHLHEDHFDPETLKALRRDVPLVLYDDRAGNYLRKLASRLGFTNLIGIRDRESKRLGPFDLTMFGPFDKHPFHESDLGNLVDSALLAKAGGHSVFNSNDNTPSLPVARELRKTYGRWTLAQINYNAAGPYPSCFDNMTREGKLEAHARVLDRNLKHLVSLCDVFEPDWLMPFAGAYVVAGKQWRKNEYLGTTTWDHAAAYVREHRPKQKTVVLNEGMTFDLADGNIHGGPYVPIDLKAQARHIEQVLSKRKYPYESDPDLAPEEWAHWLRSNLPAARANLWKIQQRLKIFPALNFYLRLPDGRFHFDFRREQARFVPKSEPMQEPYLEASLAAKLLKRIFERKFHWNSAEGGAHIDFVRVPDHFLFDAHTLLSFFHPPVTAPVAA